VNKKYFMPLASFLLVLIIGLAVTGCNSSSSSSNNNDSYITTSGVYNSWKVYVCEDLPNKVTINSKSWTASNSADTYSTIKEDSEIDDNNILKFDTTADSSVAPQWTYPLSNTAATSGTIIFRAKSLGTGRYAWEINRRLTPRVTVRGRCEASSSLVAVTDTDWHIWRITYEFNSALTSATVNVYKDEEATAVWTATQTGTDTTGKLCFGDQSSNSKYAGYYDWIIWREDAAHAPQDDFPIKNGAKLTGSPY
jgi:hypothetical protein